MSEGMINSGATTPAPLGALTPFFQPSQLPARPGVYDCHRGFGFTVLCFFDGVRWKVGGWDLETAYRNRGKDSGITDWHWRGLASDPSVTP